MSSSSSKSRSQTRRSPPTIKTYTSRKSTRPPTPSPRRSGIRKAKTPSNATREDPTAHPFHQREQEGTCSLLVSDTHSQTAAQETQRRVLEGVVEKACAAFSNIVCTICYGSLESSYSLPCGHSFCGNCLRSYFSTILQGRLAKIGTLYGLLPLEVPQTNLDIRILQLRLGRHFKNVKVIFGYPCPTCRAVTRDHPIKNKDLRELSATLRRCLGDRVEHVERPAGEVEGRSCFRGLFPGCL